MIWPHEVTISWQKWYWSGINLLISSKVCSPVSLRLFEYSFVSNFVWTLIDKCVTSNKSKLFCHLENTPGKPRTCWGDYISHLAWEHLEFPFGAVGGRGYKNTWVTLVTLLLLQLDSSSRKKMDGLLTSQGPSLWRQKWWTLSSKLITFYTDLGLSLLT